MGGSGAGGSSGTIDYPDYMKQRHSDLYIFIDHHARLAAGNNPLVGMSAWNPDNMIRQMEATVDYYDHIVHDFDPLDLWTSMMEITPDIVLGLVNTKAMDDMLDGQKLRLRNTLEEEVLPKYRRGMQDAGAVMTSAFKIGEALLWSREQQEEAALESDLKGKLGLVAFEYMFKSANDIIQLTLQKISFNKDVVHYNLELLRMGYAANKEFTDLNNSYKIEQVKWPLEMSKYMMDALGCIAGSAGTSYSSGSGASTRIASAIGGALSGAGTGMALGAMAGSTGGPVGAAIGGAVGLAAGLFG